MIFRRDLFQFIDYQNQKWLSFHFETLLKVVAFNPVENIYSTIFSEIRKPDLVK